MDGLRSNVNSYSTKIKPWVVYKVFKYGRPSIDQRSLSDFAAMRGKEVNAINASKREIKRIHFDSMAL